MIDGDKPLRPHALRVAVLGCGSVGSQVVRLLGEQADDLAARVGAPVELVGVAVRRIDAARPKDNPSGLRRELYEAMTEVARTGEGPREQIPSVGCSIKWKEAA